MPVDFSTILREDTKTSIERMVRFSHTYIYKKIASSGMDSVYDLPDELKIELLNRWGRIILPIKDIDLVFHDFAFLIGMKIIHQSSKPSKKFDEMFIFAFENSIAHELIFIHDSFFWTMRATYPWWKISTSFVMCFSKMVFFTGNENLLSSLRRIYSSFQYEIQDFPIFSPNCVWLVEVLSSEGELTSFILSKIKKFRVVFISKDEYECSLINEEVIERWNFLFSNFEFLVKESVIASLNKNKLITHTFSEKIYGDKFYVSIEQLENGRFYLSSVEI